LRQATQSCEFLEEISREAAVAGAEFDDIWNAAWRASVRPNTRPISGAVTKSPAAPNLVAPAL
jgi:hypothetical protein